MIYYTSHQQNMPTKETCNIPEKTLIGETISVNEMGKLSNSVLKSAAERIVPCDDSIKTFCANDTDYPAESINALLVPHLKQEYFN